MAAFPTPELRVVSTYHLLMEFVLCPDTQRDTVPPLLIEKRPQPTSATVISGASVTATKGGSMPGFIDS
jgi:hypothetical protein